MKLLVEKGIGRLMIVYRRSPLHGSRMGKLLARILTFFLLNTKNTIVVKKIQGVNFELDLSQVIDSSLYFSGTFEDDVEKAIENNVEPGMTAFDIGANIGYHTFRMAKLVSATGKVFAVEPTNWAFEKLKRNASLNPEINNIEYLNVGLTDKDYGVNRVKFQSSYRLDNKNEDQEEEIDLLSLDTLVKNKNIQVIDFIKLDVDGFEAQIINGAINTISSILPTILMEINPSIIIQNGHSVEEMINFLESHGYRFQTANGQLILDIHNYCSEHMNLSTMILAKANA